MNLFKYIKTFVEIVECGSISRAARQLVINPSAISKQLASLEQHLKIKLFERTTRTLALTPPGQVYYERAKSIINEIDNAYHAAHISKSEPSGQFSLGMAIPLVNDVTLNCIGNFINKYPKIQLHHIRDYRPISILDGRADIIISSIDENEELMGKELLYSTKGALVAAPSYIKRYGAPTSLHELGQHRFINNIGLNVKMNLPVDKDTELKTSFLAHSPESGLMAALHGYGLFWGLQLGLESYIEQKRLILIDLDEPAPQRNIYIYYRPCNAASIIRLFVSYIKNNIPSAN